MNVLPRPLGPSILARRLELRLSQEDLADRAEISTRTVSRIESGHDPSLRILRRIALGLECEISDLVPVAKAQRRKRATA